MKGWLNARLVADGRAVSIEGKADLPRDRTWLARTSVGDRSFATGGDTETVVLGDLWLPRFAGAVEVEIEVDRWRGRATVTAGATNVAFELVKGDAPPAKPPTIGARAPQAPAPEPPFQVPSPDPRGHPGFVQRVVRHGDWIAVFRDQRGSWVTLATAADPARATHHACFGAYGGFDPNGMQFWFSSAPETVTIVDLSSGTVAGTIAERYVVGSAHLDGDRFYTYHPSNYTETEGSIFAQGWTGAPPERIRAAPRWLQMPSFHPRSTILAWTTIISTKHRKLAWLDLETFDGGERWLTDPHELVDVAADGTITTSE